jgi:hypothetical protein
MNALAILDPTLHAQLERIQTHLAVSVYAALIFAAGFLVLTLAVLLVSFRFNRSALGLMAVYGFFTFWIPSGPTLLFSPLIFFFSIGGIVWLSMSKQAAKT